MSTCPPENRPKFNFIAELRNLGHTDVKILRDGRWAGIQRFIYTYAVCVGMPGDLTGYDDRWCYDEYADAVKAIEAWDGTGEPTGWKRHPLSGRRVAKDGTEAIWL